MLADRGRTHTSSVAGVPDGHDDEPESVRRYRQFLAGSRNNTLDPGSGESIFISNAPSMLMSDWLTTGTGRGDRISHLQLSPSTQKGIPSRPRMSTASPLSTIASNPDDSTRNISQDVIPEGIPDTSVADLVRSRHDSTIQPAQIFSQEESSVANNLPLTPTEQKPVPRRQQEWWNLCTADSPKLVVAKIGDGRGQVPEGATVRRALMNANNWLQPDTESRSPDGNLGHARPNPERLLHQSRNDDHRMQPPRIRLDAPNVLPIEVNSSEPRSPVSLVPSAPAESRKLSRYDADAGSRSGTEWDAGSEEARRTHRLGLDLPFTASEPTSECDDNYAYSMSDEGILTQDDVVNPSSVMGMVWRAWIAMLSRSEGELGDNRRLSSDSEQSRRTEPANEQPMDECTVPTHALKQESIQQVLESTTAARHVCGTVSTEDRSLMQRRFHAFYFGVPKRGLVSVVILALCASAFGDQSCCGKSPALWLQVVYCCAILMLVADLALLRFAVGANSFGKFNFRQSGIVSIIVMIALDLCLGMAQVPSRHFSRPFWPLLLLSQLPDLGASFAILLQILWTLKLIILIWIATITFLATLGIMSVRFVCPFENEECLTGQVIEASASFSNLQRAMFSVLATAFGDGSSRSLAFFSSIVGPDFAVPYCLSVLAPIGFFVNFIALSLIWREFRRQCSVRCEQRADMHRKALLHVLAVLRFRHPLGKVSARDVINAANPAVATGGALALPLWTTSQGPDEQAETNLRIAALDWLLQPTIQLAVPWLSNGLLTGEHGLLRSHAIALNATWPVRCVYNVALAVNVLATLYGGLLYDANPVDGYGCKHSARTWHCEGHMALVVVDWVVYGVMVAELLLKMTKTSLLSASASVSALAFETGLLAHRQALLRGGGAVGGWSLLIRLSRLARLLPALQNVEAVCQLSALLARLLPPLTQLSLLLFMLVFSPAAILAAWLPTPTADVPGLLDALTSPLLASFHLLASIAVGSDWPEPLLEFLQHLTPAWGGALAILLVLWWAACRVVVGMMVCVVLEVSHQSLVGRTPADKDRWFSAVYIQLAGSSADLSEAAAAAAHPCSGTARESCSARVLASGLVVSACPSLEEAVAADGDDVEAQIPFRWLQACAATRSAEQDGSSWRVSLRFWGGRFVQLAVPSHAEALALVGKVESLAASQRRFYCMHTQQTPCAGKMWTTHFWTVRLASFIDEMGGASSSWFGHAHDEGSLAAAHSESRQTRQGKENGVHNGGGEKEVSSLMSTASTRKGGEGRAVQEWSRRRAATGREPSAREAAALPPAESGNRGGLEGQVEPLPLLQETLDLSHRSHEALLRETQNPRHEKEARRDRQSVHFVERKQVGVPQTSSRGWAVAEGRPAREHRGQDSGLRIAHEAQRQGLRGHAYAPEVRHPLLDSTELLFQAEELEPRPADGVLPASEDSECSPSSNHASTAPSPASDGRSVHTRWPRLSGVEREFGSLEPAAAALSRQDGRLVEATGHGGRAGHERGRSATGAGVGAANGWQGVQSPSASAGASAWRDALGSPLSFEGWT